MISRCVQSGIHQKKSFCKTCYHKKNNQYLKKFFISVFRTLFFTNEISNTEIRYSYTEEVSNQYIWKLTM